MFPVPRGISRDAATRPAGKRSRAAPGPPRGDCVADSRPRHEELTLPLGYCPEPPSDARHILSCCREVLPQSLVCKCTRWWRILTLAGFPRVRDGLNVATPFGRILSYWPRVSCFRRSFRAFVISVSIFSIVIAFRPCFIACCCILRAFAAKRAAWTARGVTSSFSGRVLVWGRRKCFRLGSRPSPCLISRYEYAGPMPESGGLGRPQALRPGRSVVWARRSDDRPSA